MAARGAAARQEARSERAMTLDPEARADTVPRTGVMGILALFEQEVSVEGGPELQPQPHTTLSLATSPPRTPPRPPLGHTDADVATGTPAIPCPTTDSSIGRASVSRSSPSPPAVVQPAQESTTAPRPPQAVMVPAVAFAAPPAPATATATAPASLGQQLRGRDASSGADAGAADPDAFQRFEEEDESRIDIVSGGGASASDADAHQQPQPAKRWAKAARLAKHALVAFGQTWTGVSVGFLKRFREDVLADLTRHANETNSAVDMAVTTEVVCKTFVNPRSATGRGGPYIHCDAGSTRANAHTNAHANASADVDANAGGEGGIGNATRFVSHSWKYSFFEMMDELISIGEKEVADGGRPVFFWLDVVMVGHLPMLA